MREERLRLPLLTPSSLPTVLLRASFRVGGTGGLGVAVLWAAAIALGAGSGSVYGSLPLLGLLGVLAWTVSGGSALAYASTGARPWVATAAAGGACGLLFFALWIAMRNVTGCG